MFNEKRNVFKNNLRKEELKKEIISDKMKYFLLNTIKDFLNSKRIVQKMKKMMKI